MQKKLLTALALSAFVPVAACTDDVEGPSGGGDGPTLRVTISGEEAAASGIPFPAVSADEPAFVDGWEIAFERVLVTVGDVVLTDNPDMSPTDQAQTGPVVARAAAAKAVDLSKLTDAAEVAVFTKRDDGSSFDPAVRYGFGYSLVAASDAAEGVNFDRAADADYREMIDEHYAVLYVGTATFRGTSCTSSDDAYDFTALPKVVRFRFGFESPTSYVNCQNTDLKGKAFDGEESQRGVQLAEGQENTAQITLHLEHPFWSTVDHDAAEMYFDQMAVAASAEGALSLADLARLDVTSFKDASGKTLPWRSCVANKPAKSGPRRFDAGSVPIDPTAAPESALRNYADYTRYLQSAQGHLNADGLCAIKRLFPAPR